ncbi:MAG TPA: hypothetical protein P5550_07705 [Bacteroidales bacterium]|nr:hypothetical protein [Bacteroidales bacterium]HRZ76401.1 hypothetical protein [Bacteroidales bacterium]
MRFTLRALFALMIAGAALTSCNKDDDDDDSSPENYFMYDGKTYELTQGFIENYGEWEPGVYNLDLTLMSSGFTVNMTNGQIDEITGTGNALYFEMYTSDSTKLDNRTYTFDEMSTANGTFDIGFLGINFSIANQTGTQHVVTGGTVTVNKSGSTYTITWDLTDEGGKKVTGKFKKSLTLVNVDWKSPESKAEYRMFPVE